MEWTLSQLLIAVSLLSNLLNGGTHEIPKEPEPQILATSTQEAHLEFPAVLWRIAGCESGGGPENPPRQFDTNGKVLRGKVNPKDVGAWQINESYHLGTAKKLGMDIYTFEGNQAYALYLYKKNGTRDWSWSKKCWSS